MSAAQINRASPIKRARRTRAEMDAIRHGIVAIANAGDGMTVRHLFYRLVSAGVVEKTEAAYDRTVARLAVDLRRSGDIPHGQIIDGSRLYTAPHTHTSPRDAIHDTARHYRRNYWSTADRTVEVWCEKDAIRALIQPITLKFAVPLMVTRGFASESIVQDLALETRASGKPKVILSLNDYDPSGSIMLPDILYRARHYAPEARFMVEQVALTRVQVDDWDLPTRPTKISGNRHAANFNDERSVELDALDPGLLRDLLTTAIEAQIDRYQLDVLGIAEASERRTLLEMARGLA
jgi:hypothetical protein